MIAWICLFVPGIIMDRLRERLMNNDRDLKKKITDYILSAMVVNYIMIIILMISGASLNNLIDNLNNYLLFAWKYLTAACVVALLEPWLEKYLRENVRISFKGMQKDQWSFSYWMFVIEIYALMLLIMNAIRVFDNNFWGDEAYSITRMKLDFLGIIDDATKDAHPPLYHLILKLACVIAGENPVVYHLVSLVPYTLILVMSFTVIWKRYGKVTVMLFLTFASLLPNAVRFNVEVRGYAWAELFILLSFLALYGIFTKNRKKDYILFALFSLAAAYTHYYALLSVAFFYVVLLIAALLDKRIYLVGTIAVYVGTVLGYLPWLFYLLRAMRTVSADFWIVDIPTYQECFSYIFYTRYGKFLLAAMLLSICLCFLYEMGLFNILVQDKKMISLIVNLKTVKWNGYCFWMLAGIICVVGTFTVGILLSYIDRPLFVLRYMYPSTVVAWLLTAVCISRMKAGKIYAAIVLAVSLVSTLPEYSYTYKDEKRSDSMLAETLETTRNLIGKEDMILTNIEHINWTIADYYYPAIAHQYFTENYFPKLDTNVQYWLIVDHEFADYFSGYTQMETGMEKIVDDGVIGTWPVCIYKVEDVWKMEQVISDSDAERKTEQ